MRIPAVCAKPNWRRDPSRQGLANPGTLATSPLNNVVLIGEIIEVPSRK